MIDGGGGQRRRDGSQGRPRAARARARGLLDGQAEAVLVCPAGVAHLSAAAAEEGGLLAALGPVRASSRWVVAGPGGLDNAVRDS